MRTVLLDYSIAKKKEPKYEFHYNYEFQKQHPLYGDLKLAVMIEY